MNSHLERSMLLGFTVGLVGSTGCQRHTPSTHEALVVLAPSSLTEALPLAAKQCGATGDVRFVFDATPRIARQLEAGARADLVLTADLEWMEWMRSRGLLATNVETFVGNELVLVVPASLPLRVGDINDLTLASVARVAVANESVPAGRYARESLRSMGLFDRVAPKIVSGDSVRTALMWVARGEADVAIVYATDARVDDRVRVVYTLPDRVHSPIVYGIAVARDTHDRARAMKMVECLRSAPSQTVMQHAGFSPLAGSSQ